MSDCSNVMVRDDLPDFLNNQLDASRAVEVQSHLALCTDCAEELEVLRTARAVMGAAGRRSVDVVAIVAALPQPARGHGRPRWSTPWRLAATITVFALGSASVATAVRSFSGRSTPDQDSVALAPVVVAVDSPQVRGVGAVAVAAPVRLTAGGDVSDLADEDLEALIGALDRMEASPPALPEASRLTRLVSGTTGGN